MMYRNMPINLHILLHDYTVTAGASYLSKAGLLVITVGSCLSHTAVKSDSRLAQISCQIFFFLFLV